MAYGCNSMIGSFSMPDPFSTSEWASRPIGPYNYINAATLSTPRLNEGENTGIYIWIGDSNAGSWLDAQHTPVNPTKIDVLNVLDGGVYRLTDPVLGSDFSGTSFGHLATRLGDRMITLGLHQRVIFVFVSYGGITSLDFATNLAVAKRLLAAPKRLRAVGLTETAWLVTIGANEGGVSQSDIASRIASTLAIPRSAGFASKAFIGLSSYNFTVNAAGHAAQLSLINGETNLVGADTDTLTGATHRYDNAHLKGTAVGSGVASDVAVSLWINALVGNV